MEAPLINAWCNYGVAALGNYVTWRTGKGLGVPLFCTEHLPSTLFFLPRTLTFIAEDTDNHPIDFFLPVWETMNQTGIMSLQSSTFLLVSNSDHLIHQIK